MSTTEVDPKSEGTAATIAGDSSGAADDAGKPIEIAADFDRRFVAHRELARGGMGRVALATDTTLRREVAIKELIAAGDVGAVKRFEREALITARLQHPGVVGVYEFARHLDGAPALVMRRVQGRPFDQVIAATGKLEERLELLAPFISACDAVAYAHREGVIHRDLKPANVLLGDFGDTVVIDWGLAKDLRAVAPTVDSAAELDPSAPPASADLTVMGAVMGTPAYMAPEQARGDRADTRSDVYALGAMLYQLVCGAPPYGGMDSRAVVGAVLSGPPQPVLMRVPRVPPELATIVERAMARDPSARYADAGALAADLKRFQTGQLVSSHHYTTRALFDRWARKHTVALTVSAAALVALAAGGTVAVFKVIAARDRATANAESAARITDFMTSIFEGAQNRGVRADTITARSLLDRAATNIAHDLTGDELVRAQLMASIGEAYFNLGVRKEALPLWEKALEIRTRLLGPHDHWTQRTRNSVTASYYDAGKLNDAEAMVRGTLAITAQEHPEPRIQQKARALLAEILLTEGRFAESEAASREALALASSTFGAESERTADARNNLATALSREKKFDEAIAERRKLVQILSKQQGYESRELRLAKGNLATDLFGLHRYAEAEVLQREMMANAELDLGATHPDTLMLIGNLAYTLAAEKKYAEAEAMELSLLAADRKAVGPGGQFTLFTLYNLACTTALEGQPDRALGYLRELDAAGVPPEIDILHDTDLASLHGKPEFEAMLARVRAKRATPPVVKRATPATPGAQRTPPTSKRSPPARP